MGLRESDLLLRRFIEAQRSFLDEYLERHERSHGRKQDGWAMDAPFNVYKATLRGLKKLGGDDDEELDDVTDELDDDYDDDDE